VSGAIRAAETVAAIDSHFGSGWSRTGQRVPCLAYRLVMLTVHYCWCVGHEGSTIMTSNKNRRRTENPADLPTGSDVPGWNC